MKQSKFSRILHSPLGSRLIVSIVLFSSLITLIITAIQLHADYKQELSDFDVQFQQIRSSSLESLSQSVWVLDELQIRNQLGGLTQFRSVRYAAVMVDNQTRWQIGEEPGNNLISARFPLTYEHRGDSLTIGELRIVGTLDDVYRRLIDKFFFILLSNGLKTSLVALFILFLFYRLLGRHILDLATFADRVDGLKESEHFLLSRNPSRGGREDELDRLANSINRMLGTLKDREDQLRVLATTVDQSPSSVILTDTDGRIEYVNPKFTEISGYTLEEVLGKNPSLLSSGHTPEGVYRELWETISSGQVWSGEFRNRGKSGNLYWESAKIGPVFDSEGGISHFVGVKEDITLRKSYEEQLLHQANFDSLTNLPNRLLAFDRISQAIVANSRDKGHVVVMFIDLDRFKNINDTLGHCVGDTLLVDVAERLRECVRIEDTIARLGGDEFLVILPNIKDPLNSESIAEKILKSLSRPFSLKEREVYISASIGITIYPEDSDDPQSLLRNADAAMYRAKDMGRNSYCFYTRAMNEQAKARLEIESQLRQALEKGEFTLCYQPILSARSREVIGAEALLRWHNPKLGSVPPMGFIPLAEDIGLILPIGTWVLNTACRAAVAWQLPGQPPVRISVNVSVRQFRAGDIVSTVKRALEDSGLPAGCLEIEITEGLLLDDSSDVSEILTQLHEMGVKLSIDDFGTGYSALGYLKRFPFDVLKIDRSFVRDVLTDSDDAALVAAIIHMAHELGLRVIGEGVEEEQQLEFLNSKGADMVQGFLFSKPLVEAEFAKYLNGHLPAPATGPGNRAAGEPGAVLESGVKPAKSRE